MKIEHLIYIKEIARTKSISAASKHLYIGQTTLSAIVKSVEEELGLPLFHRTSSGVSLTADGEYILQEVESIIEKYHEIINYSSKKDFSSQEIIFLADSPVCRSYSTAILDHIQCGNKNGYIHFQLTNPVNIIPEIIQGAAKIGAGFLNHEMQLPDLLPLANANQVRIQKIKDEQIFIYTNAKRTDLTQHKTIDINVLSGEPYIQAGPPHIKRQSNPVHHFIQRQRFLSAIPDIQAAKKAVIAQNALTILFESSIIDDPDILAGNAAAIPISSFSSDYPIGLYLFYSVKEPLTPCEKMVANAFLTASGASEDLFL